MNEADFQDTPVEGGANDFNLEIEELKDFGKEEITVEDTAEPTTEEVSTPTEPKEEETDFTPLLDKLSKNIKYMDQEVKISSLDDVITNYQKGLNHDRLDTKLKDAEKRLSYFENEAKTSGYKDLDDYIEAVENYKTQQRDEQEVQRIMDTEGVSETIARRIIAAENKASNVEQRLNSIEKKDQDKAKEEAENMEFINEFPDVDIKTIPSEVFEESKKTGLVRAYSKYLNKKLTIELNTLRQNQANKEKAPVKGVTEHGGVVIESDDFLKGLGI